MANDALLLKFQNTPTHLGATRQTLKDCAARLGVSETRAALIAINRLHRDLHPEVYAVEATQEQFVNADIGPCPPSEVKRSERISGL